MNEWTYALLSAGAISLISLVGVFTLMLGMRRLEWALPLLISLAVGGLFGDALIHLLPEAFENSTATVLTSTYVILGILLFFALEQFLHWHHEHRTLSLNPVHPVGYTILVGDGVHNLLDGLIIGASYLISPSVGLATTVAVAAHEIPQEQGDFGVLLHAGFTPRRALLLNFLSGILAVAGVVISLLIGPVASGYTEVMVPLTAGGFLYIAGADLIPELRRQHKLPTALAQFAMIGLGLGLMYLLLLLD
jgi:zinc and cadmium transporter